MVSARLASRAVIIVLFMRCGCRTISEPYHRDRDLDLVKLMDDDQDCGYEPN